MNPRRIRADEAIATLAAFDAVIDARSPAEYADDHLPGAVNWPTLDDAQRARIGTEYKQLSAFEARKHGAALAARNIAQHLETHAAALPKGWRPLVYCWRGGQRSGSLATVLAAVGWPVTVLEGGYRDFRRAVLLQLDELPPQLRLRAVCGRTGSAKSRLLQALAGAGEPVLDLEALACHRGSVLGPLPGQDQPSQKAFETAVWQALRSLRDQAGDRPVWVEGESRTIGRLRVPEALLQRLRAAPVLQLQLPLAARVEFLLQDYAHFVADIPGFCARLDALREHRGHAVVDAWQAQARGGAAGLAGVVQALLTEHYDPVYERSMRRNFVHYAEAQVLSLPDADAATLAAAARRLAAAAASSDGAC